MSAPNTNIEKQSRRHKGPLIGIGLGVAFAGVLLLGFLGYIWEPAAPSVDEVAAPTTVTD